MTFLAFERLDRLSPSRENLCSDKSLLEVSDSGQFRLRLASVKYLMISRSFLSVRFVGSTYARLPILELEFPPSLPRSRVTTDSCLIQHDSPPVENEFEHALRHALKADLKSKKRCQIVAGQVRGQFSKEVIADGGQVGHRTILILISNKSNWRAKGEYMSVDLIELDHVGYRSFGPTPARIFNVGPQHDRVGSGLEMAMD